MNILIKLTLTKTFSYLLNRCRYYVLLFKRNFPEYSSGVECGKRGHKGRDKSSNIIWTAVCIIYSPINLTARATPSYYTTFHICVKWLSNVPIITAYFILMNTPLNKPLRLVRHCVFAENYRVPTFESFCLLP